MYTLRVSQNDTPFQGGRIMYSLQEYADENNIILFTTIS